MHWLLAFFTSAECGSVVAVVHSGSDDTIHTVFNAWETTLNADRFHGHETPILSLSLYMQNDNFY
jgi:hypothetical protein